jgi:hypothetical protein
VQGSPAARLPFDLGSIFKKAIAEDSAAAAPEQPVQAASAEEEDESSLAARVAASAVAAAVAANTPSGSQQQGEAPRGLPGLPPKPRGGLGSLPPRPAGLGLGAGLGSSLPPRRTADAEPAAAAGASSAPAAAPEAPAAAPARPAGGPVLPPRLGAAAGASSAAPMLFRRAQPAQPAGDENAAPAAAAARSPAAAAPQAPMATSVLDGSESDKVARIKLAVQKFRTDIHRVALRIKVGRGGWADLCVCMCVFGRAEAAPGGGPFNVPRPAKPVGCLENLSGQARRTKPARARGRDPL